MSSTCQSVLRWLHDKEHGLLYRYEFGGPWGVVAIMTGFPILMYYLWICLVFYDGQLVYPTSVDDVLPFLHRMWEHVRVVSRNRPYVGLYLYSQSS